MEKEELEKTLQANICSSKGARKIKETIKEVKKAILAILGSGYMQSCFLYNK